MIQIEPVVFPLNQGTATQMTVLVLNFLTDAVNCRVYYQLLTEDGILLKGDNYDLTEEQYTQWGLDNTYVNRCVADAIGVTIINL